VNIKLTFQKVAEPSFSGYLALEPWRCKQ